MVMNKDLITNVTGAIGAAALAADPVLKGVTGSMNESDWGKLIAAICVGVLGWFSGKNAQGKKKEVIPRG